MRPMYTQQRQRARVGDASMYHELHVAGARRLSAGGRQLFTEVRSWNDLLGQSDTVVLQVDDTQLGADLRVVVDSTSHVVEQLDYQLRHHVPRSRLTAPTPSHTPHLVPPVHRALFTDLCTQANSASYP